MVPARMIGIERQQRLGRRLGAADITDEIERGSQIVAERGVVRREPHRLAEMRHRCGVLAQPRIDAAQGVAPQRIVRRRQFGCGEGLGRRAVLPQHDLQPRQLRPVAALWIKLHRARDIGKPRAHPPRLGPRHAKQEARFPVLREGRDHACRKALCRHEVPPAQRAADSGYPARRGFHRPPPLTGLRPSLDCASHPAADDEASLRANMAISGLKGNTNCSQIVSRRRSSCPTRMPSPSL